MLGLYFHVSLMYGCVLSSEFLNIKLNWTEPIHPYTTSPKHYTLYGLKDQMQEGEQKGLESWAGPWAQPSQEDPWKLISYLSRKAKNPCNNLDRKKTRHHKASLVRQNNTGRLWPNLRKLPKN